MTEGRSFFEEYRHNILQHDLISWPHRAYSVRLYVQTTQVHSGDIFEHKCVLWPSTFGSNVVKEVGGKGLEF